MNHPVIDVKLNNIISENFNTLQILKHLLLLSPKLTFSSLITFHTSVFLNEFILII